MARDSHDAGAALRDRLARDGEAENHGVTIPLDASAVKAYIIPV
jgi:hypothetical protein